MYAATRVCHVSLQCFTLSDPPLLKFLNYLTRYGEAAQSESSILAILSLYVLFYYKQSGISQNRHQPS